MRRGEAPYASISSAAMMGACDRAGTPTIWDGDGYEFAMTEHISRGIGWALSGADYPRPDAREEWNQIAMVGRGILWQRKKDGSVPKPKEFTEIWRVDYTRNWPKQGGTYSLWETEEEARKVAAEGPHEYDIVHVSGPHMFEK